MQPRLSFERWESSFLHAHLEEWVLISRHNARQQTEFLSRVIKTFLIKFPRDGGVEGVERVSGSAET